MMINQSIDYTTHIGHVALNTGNLKQMIVFYNTILGFTILKQTDRTAILGTLTNLPLLILTEVDHAIPRTNVETGLDHFAILLPTRKELSRHFQWIVDHNYPISIIADHMVNESFYIHDPDDNLIEFTRDFTSEEQIGRRPNSSASLGQILSTRSGVIKSHLISPETRIGHVLLRVSSLEEAERFYTQVIGLKVSMRMNGAVFVAAGDYHHHLGFHVWETLNGEKPSYSTIGLRYFTVQVPSQGSFIEIRDKLQDRYKASQLEKRIIGLRDPSGNGIFLTSSYGSKLEEASEIDGFFESLGND